MMSNLVCCHNRNTYIMLAAAALLRFPDIHVTHLLTAINRT
jgi:hypothetical protein